MRILINTAVTISDYKIKMKNDKILIRIFSETHEIFDKSYVKLNNYLNKIKINQNLVFSSANTIIAEKTIFVLNAIFQII